ncbi:SMP-30/gluconolactonase/LRE family protein [Alteromonas sp. Cnat3-28]|uniref:SMP-30/gluconolactonase/LRE family protein n=1 Tax=Alteromonas sp. Cnat3-28 TaxID=2917729 RepID=UPI001EF51A36|nr:SMP-30/gluconolactonase/LRE family protein [Alteromonas sp. Cnat3-28]MCG7647563.1 SMP-30/gluconolactonase/LRE family protein [Alteromonas sp. Cnat3-28]
MQNARFILGESPVWQEGESSWYCVDIVGGTIHKQDTHNNITTQRNSDYVSNIVCSQRGFLVSQENRVFHTCKNFKHDKVLCTIDQPTSMRTNDGSVGPDGKYWFGTMEKHPSGLNGKIYSVDAKGTLLVQGEDIGIPNSFIWLDSTNLLITDSYLQKTFKIELLENGTLDWKNRKIWLDLSATKGTPDGGALDEDGNVWLAIWGAAVVNQYSNEGVLLKSIKLKALQPTSCAFGGVNMNELFITTANEGMSANQLKLYPESGMLIRLDMDVKGRKLPVFKYEEVKC